MFVLLLNFLTLFLLQLHVVKQVQVLYTLSNFKDGITAFNKEKYESGFIDTSVMSYIPDP